MGRFLKRVLYFIKERQRHPGLVPAYSRQHYCRFDGGRDEIRGTKPRRLAVSSSPTTPFGRGFDAPMMTHWFKCRHR